MVSSGAIIGIVIVIIIVIIIIGGIIYYKYYYKQAPSLVEKAKQKPAPLYPTFKYIKIYKDSGILNIFGVRLIKNGVEIPLKVVSASPSYNPDVYPAEAAVKTIEGKYYHSIDTKDVHLEVEPENGHSVQLPITVKIMNRINDNRCCEGRILGFRVALINDSGQIVEEKTIDKVQDEYNISFNDKV